MRGTSMKTIVLPRCSPRAIFQPACFILWGAISAGARDDPPRPAGDPPTRPRVAVGLFKLPDEISKQVTPETLSNLLVRFGQDGLRHEAVAPTDYLQAVVNRIRTGAAIAGELQDVNPDLAKARYLLLSDVSRLGDSWVMTAYMFDLTTGKQNVFEVHRAGGNGDVLKGMVDDLWRELDRPPLAVKLQHNSYVLSSAFSPDGRHLLTGGSGGGGTPVARVWEVGSWMERANLRPESDTAVVSLEFSSDGKLLFTGAGSPRGGSVRIWETETWNEKLSANFDRQVMSIARSTDDQMLAISIYGGMAKSILSIRNTHNLNEVASLKFNNWISRAAFSPDGTLLAVPSGENPGRTSTVQVLEQGTWREQRALGHAKHVNSVRFSPNSNFLATASTDGSVRIWQVGTWKELVVIQHDKGVNSVIFSSDGNLIATASDDGTARIWDWVNSSERGRVKHDDRVRSAVFSPDARWMATASFDFTARVWDLRPTR
jgi:WD40 repeat protein